MRDGIKWESVPRVDDLVVGPGNDVGLTCRKLGSAVVKRTGLHSC
jgi:hypothetical protein